MSGLTPAQAAAQMQEVAAAIASPTAAMQRIVLTVEAATKRAIVSPPTGQPPVVDTGTILRSVVGRIETAQRGLIGTSVDYARFVHDGTEFVEARPFLEWGLEAAQPAIRDILEETGAQILGQVGG